MWIKKYKNFLKHKIKRAQLCLERVRTGLFPSSSLTQNALPEVAARKWEDEGMQENAYKLVN